MPEKFRNGIKKLLENANKETMVILFLSGILIFVILLPTEKRDSQNKTQGALTGEAAVNSVSNPYHSGFYNNAMGNDYGNASGIAYNNNNKESVITYKESLERELEEFLSGVAGVGEVKALIYMKNSQEYIVEKDKQTTNSENNGSRESTVGEATVYTVNEAGAEVPFISRTVSPTIDGVVIAAKGAGEESVRLQLVHLAMALYGVEANKVEVLTLE